MYSSHTSLSFSPSLSEGAATPNSKIHHETEQNLLNDNNNALVENSNFTKKHQNNNLLCDDKEIDVTSLKSAPQMDSMSKNITMKSTGKVAASCDGSNLGSMKTTNSSNTPIKTNGKSKTASNVANGEGSYHCQFCDKTFPRLGYLKKHEQVCRLFNFIILFYRKNLIFHFFRKSKLFTNELALNQVSIHSFVVTY